MKPLDQEKLDALLMDLLYDEEPDVEGQRLDPDAEPVDPALREQVESEYADVLAEYRGVQQAYSEMPEDDPAPGVSSALLREADKVGGGASWVDRFLALFRSPGMSVAGVAAAVLLVAGVSFFVSSRSPGPGDELGDTLRPDTMATSVPNPAAVGDDEDLGHELEGLALEEADNADIELADKDKAEEAELAAADEATLDGKTGAKEADKVDSLSYLAGGEGKKRAKVVAAKPTAPSAAAAPSTPGAAYKSEAPAAKSSFGPAAGAGYGEAIAPEVMSRKAAATGKCKDAESTARAAKGVEKGRAALGAADCYERAGDLTAARRMNTLAAKTADAPSRERALKNLERLSGVAEKAPPKEKDATPAAKPSKKAGKKPTSVDAFE